MKHSESRFTIQLKQPKPFIKINPSDEKKLHLTKQNPKRLRIVQSVSAGHVRGGHSFH